PPDALAKIREATEDAGLIVSSYGSYHNVMKDENHPNRFAPVLDAAEALGTKVVRIWCGGGDSDQADDSLFEQAADRTRELADMAARRGMTLAFEFHRGGLTDTVPTAIRLLQMIDRPNVKTYYQVYDRGGAITPQDELRQLLPCLQNVHCHHIVDGKRRPVEEGKELWTGLMDVLKEADHDGFVLIEFTLDNRPDSFLRDAETLRETLGM
ncbi:MAG: sugar phosphate isomerase/epimerase, partial [Planctomycetes bacterium]|nr:sugar phosphate isomerase/epimerase [Planctomycetota bacterium]